MKRDSPLRARRTQRREADHRLAEFLCVLCGVGFFVFEGISHDERNRAWPGSETFIFGRIFHDDNDDRMFVRCRVKVLVVFLASGYIKTRRREDAKRVSGSSWRPSRQRYSTWVPANWSWSASFSLPSARRPPATVARETRRTRLRVSAVEKDGRSPSGETTLIPRSHLPRLPPRRHLQLRRPPRRRRSRPPGRMLLLRRPQPQRPRQRRTPIPLSLRTRRMRRRKPTTLPTRRRTRHGDHTGVDRRAEGDLRTRAV